MALKNESLIMHLKKLLILIIITAVMSGCAFVPELSEDQEYFQDCKTRTKYLTLSTTKLRNFDCGGADVAGCLVLAGVVIPAGSMIVSGSLVLAGNTIHWLEYHTSCENGVFLKSYNELKS